MYTDREFSQLFYHYYYLGDMCKLRELMLSNPDQFDQIMQSLTDSDILEAAE